MLKNILASLVAVGLGVASPALACPGEKEQNTKVDKKQDPHAKVTTASFAVKGMHCDGCGDKVKSALGKVDGILKVDVKIADKRIVVSFDANRTTAEKIAKVISEVGYQASNEA
jgi:copper ion binding protein